MCQLSQRWFSLIDDWWCWNNSFHAQAKRRVYHVQLGGEKRKTEKKGKRAKPADDEVLETGGKDILLFTNLAYEACFWVTCNLNICSCAGLLWGLQPRGYAMWCRRQWPHRTPDTGGSAEVEPGAGNHGGMLLVWHSSSSAYKTGFASCIIAISMAEIALFPFKQNIEWRCQPNLDMKMPKLPTVSKFSLQEIQAERVKMSQEASTSGEYKNSWMPRLTSEDWNAWSEEQLTLWRAGQNVSFVTRRHDISKRWHSCDEIKDSQRGPWCLVSKSNQEKSALCDSHLFLFQVERSPCLLFW